MEKMGLQFKDELNLVLFWIDWKQDSRNLNFTQAFKNVVLKY